MKKILRYFVVFACALICLMGSTTSIWAASASLTGPSTVRGGDTITLELKVSDKGKYGLEGVLEYDSSQVTLSSATTALKGWKIEQEGAMIIAYDDTLANSLKGNDTVVTLKFKVASNIAQGTKLTISIKDIVATDGTNESSIGKASYSVTIAKPLSTNANLSSLTVAGMSLTPGFATGTTTYNLGEVDYKVSKLDISYKTEDTNAKVSIKGNSLNVGNNTVSVVVTAENGATKTYYLNVVRLQDPNYTASSNANLKSMKMSIGTLSPIFAADVTEYIVYLPYENIGSAFTISGEAADGKAQSVTGDTIASLVEGKNPAKVVCRAEDGTEKIYQVVVFVMPKYQGEIPVFGESSEDDLPDENDKTDDTQNTEDVETEPTGEEQTTETEQNQQEKSNASVVITILAVLVVVLAGALLYVLLVGNKKRQTVN